jgi:hypothetical protein
MAGGVLFYPVIGRRESDIKDKVESFGLMPVHVPMALVDNHRGYSVSECGRGCRRI